jgi:hypothetical protein
MGGVQLDNSHRLRQTLYKVGQAMLKTNTRQANWRRTNPAKYEAHLAVQRAVKSGELENRLAKSVAARRLMPIMISTMSLCG